MLWIKTPNGKFATDLSNRLLLVTCEPFGFANHPAGINPTGINNAARIFADRESADRFLALASACGHRTLLVVPAESGCANPNPNA